MNKEEFVMELSKLRPSSTFLSLVNYKNAFGEVADYNMVFHINYGHALERSINLLSSINPTSDLEVRAKQELITSYYSSLDRLANTPVENIDDEYKRFFDSNGKYIKGVKMHIASDTLHLYGFLVNKRIINSGTYPIQNKRDLTVVKDKMRRLCPVDKFRQFKIVPTQIKRIAVENLSLLPPIN